MRVLQISTLQSGGASIAAKRLHQALLDCEIESRILTLEKHSNNDGIISYKPFLDFSSKRIIPKIVKGLLYRFGIGMGRWWRMHDEARKNGKDCHYTYPVSPYRVENHPLVRWADVIHLHFCDDFINYPTFFKKVRKPFVWTLHDKGIVYGGFHYSIDHDRLYSDYKTIEEQFCSIKHRAISSAHNLSLVALSDEMLSLTRKVEYLSPLPAYKIYNAIDTNIFKPSDKQECRLMLGLPIDKTILLFVAENVHNKSKGLHILQKTITELNNDNFVICAIGNHDERISTEEDIYTLFHGKIAEPSKLAKYYSAADFLVAPSLQEECPLTPLESMACGTPVVAFPSGAMTEYIHAEQGIVCQEQTQSSLVEGITKALNTHYDGNAIRNYVISNFSPKSIVERYINVYNEALKK